jgi:hypothetical protein
VHEVKAMSPFRADRGHPDLDQRLQARALVLALERRLTVPQAADALEAMAGATPAAPIAARRALARLVRANRIQPSDRTQRAIESLRLALTHVQERRTARTGRAGNGAATDPQP